MRYLDVLTAAFTIGLASTAVWRVIAVDTITKPIRVWFFNETRDDAGGRLYGWLKKWYKCPWCAGAWVTAAIVLLTDIVVGLPAPLLVFLAARFITGWLGSNDKDYHEQMMRGEP